MNIRLHTTTRHTNKMEAQECKVRFCRGRIAHDETGDLDRHGVSLVVKVGKHQKTFTNSQQNNIYEMFITNNESTAEFTATVEII